MKKKVFIFMVITFFFALIVKPFVVMNDIVPVFPVEARDEIEGAVIEGAIHFLQAKSYTALLLQEYERSGRQAMNYTAALGLVEKAIIELETSKTEYTASIAAGTRSGYVAEKIEQFKVFDYDSFTSENSLNKDLMLSVKSYLSCGNILGAYQENVDNICKVLATLKIMKEKFEENTTPDISSFWQLLQQFSRATLFANYCTITATAVLQ